MLAIWNIRANTALNLTGCKKCSVPKQTTWVIVYVVQVVGLGLLDDNSHMVELRDGLTVYHSLRDVDACDASRAAALVKSSTEETCAAI